MTRVVARIQHHPSRQDLIPELLASLAPLPVVVSSHASDPPNPWDGYQLALQSGLDDPTKPTHLLLLQDDVRICRNLPPAVELIARAHDDGPVALFLARLPAGAARLALQAAKGGVRYIQAPRDKFFPAVAVLWPIEIARSFLEWTRSGVKLPGYPNEPRSDDAIIGEWLRRTQAVAWYTVPSLVQHPDDVASLIGKRAQWGRDRGRVALNFIGDGDPLDLAW